MRSHSLLTAGAALLIGTTGAAADGAPAPEGAPRNGFGYATYEEPDWSGIYAGALGGWTYGENEVFTLLPEAIEGPFDYDRDGFAVGGLFGINMQVGPWVYGGEIDVEYADITGQTGNDTGEILDSEIGVMGSVRARVGFAFERLFVYGTGGLAVGKVEMDAVDGTSGVTLSNNQTEFGWAAGGGVEVEIWRNWSAGVEYRYTDLGETEIVQPLGPVDDLVFSYSNQYHAIRARLVYRLPI